MKKKWKNWLEILFSKPTLESELKRMEKELGYNNGTFLKDKIWTWAN